MVMEREWENEPDELEWIDPATELRCLALRPHPTEVGSLCGYVAIPDGHLLNGAEYETVDIDCHGGLTFSGNLPGRAGWWIGFDCAHVGDLSPVLVALIGHPISPSDVYRNIAFVQAECAKIARQVNAYGMERSS